MSHIRLINVVLGGLLLGGLAPSWSFGQSLDETVTFLTKFIGKQGIVRAPSCHPEDGERLTLTTEVYAAIPTGTNLGLVELNHGTGLSRIGRTIFDLHDIASIEEGGAEQVDQTRTYQSVRVTCRGKTPCIEKLTFCVGDVSQRRVQVRVDSIFFRGASSAERIVKAFAHLQELVAAKDKASPF
ncbi:hypothetical protein YTPLAS18_07160 [Nitrospira sp.]|nr:hypothetical protein YTPLAS18_07160 [Nitrospira sp.]